jgi:hypothetical protein
LDAGNKGDARALGHRSGFVKRDEFWCAGGRVVDHEITFFKSLFRAVFSRVAEPTLALQSPEYTAARLALPSPFLLDAMHRRFWRRPGHTLKILPVAYRVVFSGNRTQAMLARTIIKALRIGGNPLVNFLLK